MPIFMITGTYSSGAWARMMASPEDRVAAARSLAEALGGSLENVFWDASCHSALAIADLPDPVSAMTAATVASRTGAFKSVESHELLTQDQMTQALTVANDVAQVYTVPGQSAMEPSP